MGKQAQGNDLSRYALILLVLLKQKHLMKTINIMTLTALFYSKYQETNTRKQCDPLIKCLCVFMFKSFSDEGNHACQSCQKNVFASSLALDNVWSGILWNISQCQIGINFMNKLCL